MKQPVRQNIVIYDHPESKIRFLEQSLMDNDWRATVVLPRDSLAQQELLAMLGKRGYMVQQRVDDAGRVLLEIHHIGKDTALTDVFHEAGFLHGVGHAILHPTSGIKRPLQYGRQAYDWTVGSLHDPARANGVINTVAEGFLTVAGSTAKTGKKTDAKNLLQTFAGLSWLSQSLIFLAFAKNNENRASGIIKDKLDSVVEHGGDVSAITFDATKDAEKDGFFERAGRFMSRYPVTIGAMMNNIGMMAYMGHAVLERRYHRGVLASGAANAEALDAAKRYIGSGVKGFREWIKTGFGKDIFGASLSLAGWSVLMIPPTKHVPDSEQVVERGTIGKIWNVLREHTPFEAGLLTLGASGFRLMGATSKGNFMQQVGERIYIGGDLALMFTNSHEYGGDAKLNEDSLSTKILDHVGKLPTLLGPAEQTKFVDHLLKFWLDKYRADAALSGKDPKTYQAWIERSAVEAKQAVMRKVRHQQNARLEHMAECMAEIVSQFPQDQRDDLGTKMTVALCALPWVKATADEFKPLLSQAMQAVSADVVPNVNERDIATNVSQMSKIVPNIDAAQFAAAMHDVLAPFMQQRPALPTHTVHQVAHQAMAANDPSLTGLRQA